MFVYVFITAKRASKRLSMKNSICMYICVYVCICMYLFKYDCIYLYVRAQVSYASLFQCLWAVFMTTCVRNLEAGWSWE